MAYIITTATKKIDQLTKRLKIIQGGTSAGKTIGVLEILIDRCQSRDHAGDITSVVSESFPHLKRGAIRDFSGIMEAQGYFDPRRWNKTDSFYTFETGAVLEFFSPDQPGKVRGPRRKRLFMNEANRLSFETFEQLEVRTDEEIFIDYNPSGAFWVQEYIIDKRTDYDFVKLTYKDNEALNDNIIQSIESRRDRKDWWKVYGLGELGEIEGKIYSDWAIIPEIPHEAKLVRYGLDFGYFPDPAAVVAIYKYNGGFILDEIAYQTHLMNDQLADIIKLQPQALVVADSAEPKSIAEIAQKKITIIGAAKGQDSVRNGIKTVQNQRISVTNRSLNIIREYRNYLWMKDKNDRVIPGEPEHEFSHTMDAIRYGFEGLVQKPVESIKQFRPDYTKVGYGPKKPTMKFGLKPK